MGHRHRPRLAITTLIDTTVQHRGSLIHGKSRAVDPSWAIQLMVLGHDRRWYLQKPATRHGSLFSVETVFGTADPVMSPEIREYVVVAVTGPTPVHGSPVVSLPPDAIVSNAVVVRRIE